MTKPDDILSLFREMSVQETPEAAATAALAWALRHAPVDGGSLEISGHRIERIAPEHDPWPTAPLIVATDATARRLYCWIDPGVYRAVRDGRFAQRDQGDTLTNVVPVTVVPAAQWDALREVLARWNTSFVTEHREVAQAANRLLAHTDALEVDL